MHLLILTLGFSALLSTSTCSFAPDPKPRISYKSQSGFFIQDDPSTKKHHFNYTEISPPNQGFGLLNDGKGWPAFLDQVNHLNNVSNSTTESYKVLFLQRHGEGVHNAAYQYFGPDFPCYYGRLSGNATANWTDTHLTEHGEEQARIAHRCWGKMISEQGMRLPEKYYTSPLFRALQTTNLTYLGLKSQPDAQFRPVILEDLREHVNAERQAERSSKTFIHEHFPDYVFEEGFPEGDPYWKAQHKEDRSAFRARTRRMLDRVFRQDESRFIAITSHALEIGEILGIVEHRGWRPRTGEVLPVLVRAWTSDDGEEAEPYVQLPFLPAPGCDGPTGRREHSCNYCLCC